MLAIFSEFLPRLCAGSSYDAMSRVYFIFRKFAAPYGVPFATSRELGLPALYVSHRAGNCTVHVKGRHYVADKTEFVSILRIFLGKFWEYFQKLFLEYSPNDRIFIRSFVVADSIGFFFSYRNHFRL